MFQQLAMFDIPPKTFINRWEQADDLKTIDQWAYYGFKVASECVSYPVAYVCQCGKPEPVYDFWQVDPVQKVKIRTYNLRLQWLDSAVIRDCI